MRDAERIPVSSRSVPVQKDRVMSELCFSKVGFLAFIAMVINCTAEMESKLQKIYVVVEVTGRYLGIRDLTPEELQRGLSGGVPSSQAVGVVNEQIGSK